MMPFLIKNPSKNQPKSEKIIDASSKAPFIGQGGVSERLWGASGRPWGPSGRLWGPIGGASAQKLHRALGLGPPFYRAIRAISYYQWPIIYNL